MFNKAQASRMEPGYELWNLTERNKDGTPARCYVTIYTDWGKRKPGEFMIAARRRLASKAWEVIVIGPDNTEWIRPCDWRVAEMQYIFDNSGRRLPPYRLDRRRQKRTELNAFKQET